MGTRGLYGMRKNGIDKTTYNHFDSYPDWLGVNVLEFCKCTSIDEMHEIYDKMVMVDEEFEPTREMIKHCLDAGYIDTNVSSKSIRDTYCLLRAVQGNLKRWSADLKAGRPIYVIDNQRFIEDSLWCEYAYIINLDTNMLEFYKGFQKKPDEKNRYGTKEDNGYYPCKCLLEIPLNGGMTDEDVKYYIGEMDKVSEDENYPEY